MGMIAESELGRIVVEHHRSLPYDVRSDRQHAWPWVTMFYVVPAGAAAGLAAAGVVPSRAASIGLLAGVGVLGGLLFQVLAWVSGRIGALADSMSVEAPAPAEVALIGRLDIARANIAYASLVSIVFVVELGVVALLDAPPDWLAIVSAFLMFHFALTLVLMLLRINAIGRTDRVNALTRKARHQSQAG